MVIIIPMVKWHDSEDGRKDNAPRQLKPSTLRGALKPGQILIILAGKHSGKRVVFLKQLASGLLLLNGPYALNGVYLKRVPQAFTLPTCTSIDVSSIDLSGLTDAHFSAALPESQHFAQRALDNELLSVLKDPLMRKYLKTKFKLRTGMFPHTLRF